MSGWPVCPFSIYAPGIKYGGATSRPLVYLLPVLDVCTGLLADDGSDSSPSGQAKTLVHFGGRPLIGLRHSRSAMGCLN